jgi:tRNA-dihydrouridine synthase A
MLDWTDRHCRALHRAFSAHARLYTEMITTGALLHGDAPRHLDFDACEHPVALQLGGSDPAELARCARMGEQWGYDEINLNCGCPSERVQRGSFGVCLMADPRLVAECVRAMRGAVAVPVSVKHRIGIDRDEEYGFVRDFVGQVHEAGCSVFIVHARNAWLHGLSPKENREVPPLRPEVAMRLRADFPGATIVLNGGLSDVAGVQSALRGGLEGVMIGRAAYHGPLLLAHLEQALFGGPAAPDIPEAIDIASGVLERAVAGGALPWSVIRHALGLVRDVPGARLWRRSLSDPGFVAAHGVQAFRIAAAPMNASTHGTDGMHGSDCQPKTAR